MRIPELQGPGDEALIYEAWRHRAVRLLLRASSSLLWLAMQLGRHPIRRRLQHLPELEFYAEAGAPEGALFIDGARVGTLPGVRRL